MKGLESAASSVRDGEKQQHLNRSLIAKCLDQIEMTYISYCTLMLTFSHKETAAETHAKYRRKLLMLTALKLDPGIYWEAETCGETHHYALKDL